MLIKALRVYKIALLHNNQTGALTPRNNAEKRYAADEATDPNSSDAMPRATKPSMKGVPRQGIGKCVPVRVAVRSIDGER